MTSPVRFDSRQRPVDRAEVEAVESRLGVKLPEDYVAFLLTQNGGDLVEMVAVPGIDIGLECLYSVGATTPAQDLEHENREFQRLYPNQRNHAAIAYSPSGDFLVLSSEAVVWFTPDEVIEVASTFSHLLDVLEVVAATDTHGSVSATINPKFADEVAALRRQYGPN